MRSLKRKVRRSHLMTADKDSVQDMCCHGDGEQGLNWDGVR